MCLYKKIIGFSYLPSGVLYARMKKLLFSIASTNTIMSLSMLLFVHFFFFIISTFLVKIKKHTRDIRPLFTHRNEISGLSVKIKNI